MRILSWNVNGIRAVLKKDFLQWFNSQSPDVLCLQETKISDHQIDDEVTIPSEYYTIWSCAKRKGYSGVANFLKNKPISEKIIFEKDILNNEGRIIETEHNDFFLYNVYFPNGQKDDERLKFKLDFYKEFLDYVLEKKETTGKEIIITGDFNTAHTAIDLKNPKENENYSGFMPIEREWVTRYIEAGFVDIFRELHQKEEGHYTWWTYRFGARDRNVGWRIDYFMITKNLVTRVKDCGILKDVLGSDHCPIFLELE
ncbi:MAG: exodeoxyribonuclease III [Spirochaetes bacterium GWD1_27_9]|nr:MAG: exodeoxyribonuclease III [Spirochaetes bacterium GWC1_27_15]OHD28661.1 MAG: exodeoxyribonuclease III [Spirochaetes bacterium GWD1_27_9]